MRYLVLIALFAAAPAMAACPLPADMPPMTVCVDFQPPTENTDGSPLTDLAGYKIYYGFAARAYGAPIDLPDPTATSFTGTADGVFVIPNPGPNGGVVPVYVAMTALDSSGNESAYSNEVLKDAVFPDALPPAPPGIITVLINVET